MSLANVTSSTVHCCQSCQAYEYLCTPVRVALYEDLAQRMGRAECDEIQEVIRDALEGSHARWSHMYQTAFDEEKWHIVICGGNR
eukprot:SAG11_NODE_1010_length_6199_cov_2.572131_5_plen_85_part_00